MNIIKIVPASQKRWERFIPYLTQELKALEKDRFIFQLTSAENGMAILQCEQYPKHLSSSEIVDTYRHFFSTALAEYIIEEIEEDCIEKIIKNDFGFVLQPQIKAIYRYCYQYLFMDEEKDMRDELKIVERKCKIFRKAYEYLEEKREFNLEGFIRFRLKEYIEELTEVIEYAIDEYIIDKEYKEFVQLLRYFISKQKAKLPFLHVYHIQDRQFALFDEAGEKVSDQDIEYYLKQWAVHTVSYEDIIVSTLITLAPKRMILHTDEPSYTVIDTLKSIFQDQLTVCTDCEHCQKWKQYKKSDSNWRG
jgi:putative sporulation protein YtxC